MVRNSHDDLLTTYFEYLRIRGYQAAKIREGRRKTPDLNVTKDGATYLNKFKSPELLLDPKLGLFRFATTNSKLLQFVHTANKQFAAHDPDHNQPWVITFASTHMQLHWHSLFEAMQGGSVINGQPVADWSKAAVFKRWSQERYITDLYVWLQISDLGAPYQASFFTNDRSVHRSLVDRFAADLGSIPLSSMDNVMLVT